MLTAAQRGDDVFPALARQVRAIGQAGDVLLAISITGQEASLLPRDRAAHERDMTVLALTGHGGSAMGLALRETDVQVCVPADARRASTKSDAGAALPVRRRGRNCWRTGDLPMKKTITAVFAGALVAAIAAALGRLRRCRGGRRGEPPAWW